MSDYKPKTWKYGEELTPDAFNHIEQGIKANADAIDELNNNLAWKMLIRGSGYATETTISLSQKLSSCMEILICVKYDNNTFASSRIPIQAFIDAKLSATGYASFNDSTKNGGYIRYVNDSSVAVWTSTNDILVTCYTR